MSDIGAIVLFSGPGGSTLGLHQAGVTNTLGIEINPAAVRTSLANGFRVCRQTQYLLRCGGN